MLKGGVTMVCDSRSLSEPEIEADRSLSYGELFATSLLQSAYESAQLPTMAAKNSGSDLTYKSSDLYTQAQQSVKLATD